VTERVLNKKRGIAKIMTALLLISAAISVIIMATAWERVTLDESYQAIKLNVLALDERGEPLPMAWILIFNLTERGSVRIATSRADELGRCSITLKIYRLHVGWTNVVLDREGREVFKRVPVPVFAAHNIIIVVHKYPYHAVRAVPLDPTFMKWPIDEIELRIVARRVFIEKSVMESLPPSTSITHPASPTARSPEYILIDSCNNWTYTNAVVFATWYNVSAYARWHVGSKYEVETKSRVSYDGVNWEPWLSAGSTQITIDRDLETRSFTGNSKVLVKFEYEYRVERYHVIDWETGEEWYEDWAFAIDHTSGVLDPRGYDKVVTTWDGARKGGNYVEIEQGDEAEIPIKGGMHWTFSINVQFTLSVPPPAASVRVTLGVTKVIAPYGYVYYAAGARHSGYEVYVYDANTNWLKMYATWRAEP